MPCQTWIDYLCYNIKPTKAGVFSVLITIKCSAVCRMIHDQISDAWINKQTLWPILNFSHSTFHLLENPITPKKYWSHFHSCINFHPISLNSPMKFSFLLQKYTLPSISKQGVSPNTCLAFRWIGEMILFHHAAFISFSSHSLKKEVGVTWVFHINPWHLQQHVEYTRGNQYMPGWFNWGLSSQTFPNKPIVLRKWGIRSYLLITREEFHVLTSHTTKLGTGNSEHQHQLSKWFWKDLVGHLAIAFEGI